MQNNAEKEQARRALLQKHEAAWRIFEQQSLTILLYNRGFERRVVVNTPRVLFLGMIWLLSFYGFYLWLHEGVDALGLAFYALWILLLSRFSVRVIGIYLARKKAKREHKKRLQEDLRNL